MRVNETDNDQVICANIQNKLKAGHGLHNSPDSIFFKLSCNKIPKRCSEFMCPLFGLSLMPPSDLPKMVYYGDPDPRSRSSSCIIRKIIFSFHQLLNIMI